MTGLTLVAIVRIAAGASPARAIDNLVAAWRRTRTPLYLLAPRYLIFAADDEIEVTGGKLRRAVARRAFPAILERWSAERRQRLIKVPFNVIDASRTLRRILVEVLSRVSVSRIVRKSLTLASRKLWSLVRNS